MTPDSAIIDHDDVTISNTIVVEGADILTPDGWRRNASMVIRDDRIEEITASSSNSSARRINAHGLWALPGIIDLHGDAFERHISPRPSVSFPLSLAIEANDASLVNAGITTFYYSITDGFEPGLRGRDTVRELLINIEKKSNRLLCDSRIHIRHEQAATEDHEELLDWLACGRIHLLSLNNHLPPLDNHQKFDRYLNGASRRLSMQKDEARDFVEGLLGRLPTGAGQLKELADVAQLHNIPLASHDDSTADDVARAVDYGVNIAEFPMTSDVAQSFRTLGVHVLMGAPNAVRGVSHTSGTSVRDAIADNLVDTLCSDYHYPSLLRAPFLMNELGLLDFAEAWKMVSSNPADAANLGRDKGTLEVGKIADVILVAAQRGEPLDLLATITKGRLVMSRL